MFENKKNVKAAKIVFGIGVACIIASLMLGCGKTGSQGVPGAQGSVGTTGTTGIMGATGPTAPTPSPSPSATVSAVQEIVNGYNEYLVSQGSDPLTSGLRCTLYNVPNMPASPCLLSTSVSGCTTIASSTGYTTVGSYTYTGALDQPNESGTNGFNILPATLRGLYATDFAVTCTGYFVNTDYNYHEFDVESDDGALLYINGGLLINNDGVHSVTDVKAEKYLEAQVYSFQVNYFQGPGNVALVVNMDGNVLPSANLWH